VLPYVMRLCWQRHITISNQDNVQIFAVSLTLVNLVVKKKKRIHQSGSVSHEISH